MNNQITRVHSGAFVTNTYFINSDKGHSLIIDPASTFGKEERILEGRNPDIILLTHAHIDHFYDAEKYREKYGSKVFVHILDEKYLSDSSLNAPSIGENDGYELRTTFADGTFSDGDVFEFEKDKIKVIHTPGHTEGSCCFLCDNYLFSGDTLFLHSVGRTDFPLGDMKSLLMSVDKLISSFSDNINILPGHGFSTTIGEERHNNPFYNK